MPHVARERDGYTNSITQKRQKKKEENTWHRYLGGRGEDSG